MSYDAIINSYKRASKVIFNESINKPEIWNILEDANTNDLKKINKSRYDLLIKLSPLYERLKKMHVRQFHFHLPNNKSFLRFHRPSKFGDDLSEIRYSVKMTNKDFKSHIGFEEGRIFNGFRYVFPIITNKKKHLGSVEISVDFKSIEKELYKLFPKEYYLLIDKDIVEKKVFSSEQSNYKQSLLHKQFKFECFVNVSEKAKVINKKIKNRVKNILGKKQSAVLVCKYKDEDYLVTFYSISNIEGFKSAYIISYVKNDAIDKLEKSFYATLFGIVVFFMIISYLIFKLKNSEDKYRLMIEESGDAIAIRQNGKFVFVNQAFAQMLDYTIEELLKIDNERVFSEIVLQDTKDIVIQNTNKKSLGIRYEMILSKKDATKISVEINGKDIIYNNKMAQLEVIRDITIQKEMMKILEKGMEQTKGLNNFISICAGCSKIQNKEKEGKPWVKPEVYISERLPDIKFSHGMCPDCIKKWYPHFNNK